MDLPLGSSSRYLFKISLMPSESKNKMNERLLSVINYKGSKLGIMTFRLGSKVTNELSGQKIIRTP